MQLSRVALRRLQRALRGNSLADEPGQIESRSDFCGTLSVRGTGRLYLGAYDFSRDASSGEDCRGAGAGDVQREIQDHASGVRAAFAHRPRNYRADGSGARAVCAPIVVLAKQAKHSREGEEIRADSERVPHEPTFAEHEQRAISIAEENDGRAGDHDD